MQYTPEVIMPADKDYVEMNDNRIRKGTMAAALTNAKIVSSATATDEEKQLALETIRALAPTLIVFGLMEFLQWKSPKIQAIFDQFQR